tara:strand:- start:360 stop:473 length:114 start_codon:yes stop_codon:yes gene_type:complete
VLHLLVQVAEAVVAVEVHLVAEAVVVADNIQFHFKLL